MECFCVDRSLPAAVAGARWLLVGLHAFLLIGIPYVITTSWGSVEPPPSPTSQASLLGCLQLLLVGEQSVEVVLQHLNETQEESHPPRC